MLSFYENRCSCRYIFFLHIRSCTEATCGSVWYAALEPFGICTFYWCTALYRTARALLNPLPIELGLLAERLPQPFNAVCAYRLKLAGIHFPQS